MVAQRSAWERADVEEAFGRAYGVCQGRDDFLAELEASFRIGAGGEALTADERAFLEAAFDRIQSAAAGKPPIEEAYARLRRERPTARLSLPAEHSAGETHRMSDLEREIFAHFGVLPAHHIESMSEETLRGVERTCDFLFMEQWLGSTVGYLFCRHLLELALHPEIVGRVSGLLGNDVTFLACDGPMYLAPHETVTTQWHSAAGQDFGGGSHETNLDHVSVWVALTDASVANGCMKMVPRSFPANLLRDELIGVKTWGGERDEIIPSFTELDYRVDDALLRQILARRIGYAHHRDLYYEDGQGGAANYSGFHNSIDRDMFLGAEHRELAAAHDVIALEARRGDCIMFTSLNTHAAFPNQTGRWRKAISLRYARTDEHNKTDLNHHYDEIRSYCERFPGARAVLDAAGKTPEIFRDTLPRICVKGDIPPSQEALYFDADFLRSELAARDPLGLG